MTDETRVTDLFPVDELEYSAPDIGNQFKLLDGIPVPKELAMFGNELRKKRAFRQVKFGAVKIAGKHKKVAVYFPDQLYVLGFISYGDHMVGYNSKDKYTYCIDARTIKNNKYRVGSKAYTWSLTESLTRALSNAQKYLRPYSTFDIVQATYWNATARINSAVSEYLYARGQKLNALARDVGGGVHKSKVYAELKHLYETGYKFQTDGLREMVEETIESEKAYIESSTKKYQCMLVYKDKPVMGRDHVRIVDVGEIFLAAGVDSKLNKRFRDRAFVESNNKLVAIDELPLNTQQKIAMAAMMDNGDYVEGVGYKDCNEILYLLFDSESNA